MKLPVLSSSLNPIASLKAHSNSLHRNITKQRPRIHIVNSTASPCCRLQDLTPLSFTGEWCRGAITGLEFIRISRSSSVNSIMLIWRRERATLVRAVVCTVPQEPIPEWILRRQTIDHNFDWTYEESREGLLTLIWYWKLAKRKHWLSINEAMTETQIAC